VFCLVQRQISLVEKISELLAGLPLTQTNTYRYSCFNRPIQDRLLGDMLPDSFGYFPPSFHGATGQHHKKFFAAVSADIVVFTDSTGNSCRYVAEYVIASQVAVAVIDSFEEI
jgi:hypothetical protein